MNSTARGDDPRSRRVREIQAHSLRPTTRPPKNVVSLASGEPDFATPRHISQALADAVANGATHYAAWDGDPELRGVIAEFCSQPGEAPRAAENVLVTHGASAAITAAILGTVDPGDKVVIPTPTYSLYADIVRMAGGVPVFVPPGPGLRVDVDAVAAAAEGARMLVLCNPCNPTGIVLAAEELAALAEVAERHDLLVLSDEAYDHIVFEPEAFTSALALPGLRERLLYVQTLSKTYAMTGWRIGYLVAPAPALAAAAQIHRSVAGPLNTAVQRAGIAALTGTREPQDQMLAEYTLRRALTLETLREIPDIECGAPEGTFYAFVKHAPDVPSSKVVAAALDQGVAIRSGGEFHGEGHVRVSFSVDRTTLAEGLVRLRKAFARVG